MKYLAMCDFSITSRVCCTAVGQNSLCSIVLGVILGCYFSGCSCCYKRLPWRWKQRGASRTPPADCLHPRESNPHVIPGARGLLRGFSTSCATIALAQQAGRVAAREQLVATLLQPHFSRGRIPAMTCFSSPPGWHHMVAPEIVISVLHVHLIQNAWSILRPCSSPSEWHLDGSTGGLCCVLGSGRTSGGWWAGSVHFEGQAGEDGDIVISVLVTQQPPGPCPGFLVGSSQLTLSESTQVDEYIQMWMTRE